MIWSAQKIVKNIRTKIRVGLIQIEYVYIKSGQKNPKKKV